MAAAGSDLAARLRDRLRQGELVLSTFVKLGDTEIVEVLATSGLDAMVVDMEHSQLDDADVRRLVRHAAAIEFPAIVRIPAVDDDVVNRLLEAGAAGIQLSSVTCRRHVDELLEACRYPPFGSRSVSLAQPDAGYGSAAIVDYLRRDPPLVVGQIESGKTDEPLSELVDGLDVVFVGLTDLSVSMGVPGRFDDPSVVERVTEIAAAAAGTGAAGDGRQSRAGCALGGWVPDMAAARTFAGGQARYVTVGSDLTYLRSAVRGAFGPAARAALTGANDQR